MNRPYYEFNSRRCLYDLLFFLSTILRMNKYIGPKNPEWMIEDKSHRGVVVSVLNVEQTRVEIDA